MGRKRLLSLEEILYEVNIEYNIRYIDSQLNSLARYIGRELTEAEENEILDIVDLYTPKDLYGNYKYPLIPFEYAWTIYCVNSTRDPDNWLN